MLPRGNSFTTDCNFHLIIHETASVAPNSQANARLSTKICTVHQMIAHRKEGVKANAFGEGVSDLRHRIW
jgi:hypothetical protein